MKKLGGHGPAWTRKKFDAVWKKYQSGVPATELAKEHGCTTSNIYRRLRKVGYSPDKLARKLQRLETQGSRIYTLRKQGKSFDEVAVELELEPSPATTRKLYMRLVRYCKSAGVIYPRLPAKRKPKRSPRPLRRGTVLLADLSAVTQKIRSLAAPGCPVGNTELAAALGVSPRDLNGVLAELRRRRVLSDGLVPTSRGIELAEKVQSSYCWEQVLASVVTAWTTGKTCETLGSLDASLDFCRSSINVAIIGMREKGLLHPRGLLILRPEYT